MKWARRILLTGFAVVVLVGLTLWWAAPYFSANRPAVVLLPPGNVEVPAARTRDWDDRSPLTVQVLTHWADTPLPDWRAHGKTKAPRALLGRFALRRDVEQANAYLQAAEPWGRVGSSWALHADGDYDFTLAALIPILFNYGDDPTLLYPETVNHLVNVLLTEQGGGVRTAAPNTLGLVGETENHLLMTEGSRYLKNRWVASHGGTDPANDNRANGLEAWLLALLTELREAGPYEFNSIPYEGYTLTALLNLEAFGSAEVRASARGLLDELNWQYAVGSLGLRRYPPFRRQRRHAGDTKLDGDYHTALMKGWLSLLPDGPAGMKVESGGLHHALWACWSPYRLADQTAQWTLEKPRDYFIQIGHGPGSSPEVYSGGPGYLFTAGGVSPGVRSQVVARPTTLMLDDGAERLADVVHLAGPGQGFDDWNNTGVWRRFAVAAGPVSVPALWRPDAESDHWAVYQRGAGICVVVHSGPDLGVVHLSTAGDPAAVLAAVAKRNGGMQQLRQSFVTPDDARIHYDLSAPPDRWVITRAGDSPLDREFAHWPRMEER